MTAAHRELAFEGLKAALAAIGSVATVYRGRAGAIPAAALTAIVIRDGGNPEPENFTGQVTYQAQALLELHIAAADDQALQQKFADLLADIVAALEADITLGGVTEDVIEGATGELVEASKEGAPCYGVAECIWILKFTTPFGQPRA
jgi:hypothetical protein